MGAVVVMVFATFILPNPPQLPDPAGLRLLNIACYLGYTAVALPVGVLWGLRTFRSARQLTNQERGPNESEQLVVLRGPLRLSAVHASLWGLGTVGATVLNGFFSPLMAVKVGLTTLLGAVTTCSAIYLVTERLLRDASALVLSWGLPRRSRLLGVSQRTVLTWALGTAVPVLGLLLTTGITMLVPGTSRTQLDITVLALGATALIVGFGITYLSARAVADPIESVRGALARVERGALDVEIEVYDGTEIGLLQAGFNQMVAGLRERERLQDLFGRHVGREVARGALSRGVELGGELREVAAVFVDLTHWTRLAATREPGEVVALLNSFFGVVIEEVERHSGWINKFEGDAALAVFGAPLPLDDAPTCALACARKLTLRLREELPGLQAGVGVSTGTVVAGNIGSEQRFEYTVIGDPVNEAARLTELAKSASERVLASGAALDQARAEEAEHWRITETVNLRGRTEPTRLVTLRPQ